MRTYTVDLSSTQDFPDIVSAFNIGLVMPSGGEWNGKSWDAFHDYLSWPKEDSYELVILGWNNCTALSEDSRSMMQSIFSDNYHVKVKFL